MLSLDPRTKSLDLRMKSLDPRMSSLDPRMTSLGPHKTSLRPPTQLDVYTTPQKFGHTLFFCGYPAYPGRWEVGKHYNKEKNQLQYNAEEGKTVRVRHYSQ